MLKYLLDPSCGWPGAQSLSLLTMFHRDNYQASGKQLIVLDNFANKDYLINASKSLKTLEFRFFEMTETWEEQKLQLEFLWKYIKWVLGSHLGHASVNFELTEKAELMKISMKNAEFRFRTLCGFIGVDWKLYKPFIQRNLYPRWEQRRKRV